MIKLDALHKYFNKGKSNEIHVINDVSLDFPDHGMVAIFGRSGCGKTTLLNVIGGLDKVQSGKVYLGSAEMKPGRDELRNQYIGYIFQNYCLNGNDTCYENVATSLRLCGMEDEEEISKRVHAALAAVGMDTFYKRVPNSLSGGQQQRIAIARAIVKNPQIILADEPTGNLDETNTIVIMDILKQLSKTRLVLLVTHEENLVDYYCDSVIELSDGRVVNVRNNSESNGYVAKDKNTIYLGEYDRKVFDNEAVHMSYYGDLPETPVKVRMINRNGALYLKVETPGVHVLDETSEIHLEKGKFEEQRKAAEEGEKIDLSDLTDFTGKNYGRLFGFRDGIKSGLSMITASSSKKKKTAKRLRRVMACFAVALVFVVARFGVGIKEYKEAKENCKTDLISVDVGSFENPEKIVAEALRFPLVDMLLLFLIISRVWRLTLLPQLILWLSPALTAGARSHLDWVRFPSACSTLISSILTCRLFCLAYSMHWLSVQGRGLWACELTPDARMTANDMTNNFFIGANIKFKV